MANIELEQIDFDGTTPIEKAPHLRTRAPEAIDDWLLLASPDDLDCAGWMIYGGGVLISTEESLDSMTTTRTYDLGSLGLKIERDTLDSMIDLIQTRVDYNGWRDNGGSTGIIQSFGDLLVIQTTEAHHASIAILLNEYRAANAP